jgi:protein gp37
LNGGHTASANEPQKRIGSNHGDGPFKRLSARNGGVSFAPLWLTVFDNKAPKGARDDLFHIIRHTPTLDWLLLSKRPENISKMLPADWGDGYSNVWLGTTAEDQKHYDRRWSVLRRTPAVVRFISYEPALGPLNIAGHWGHYPDWIICGGESGSQARYMEPKWAYDLRDQCSRLDVPYFFKQMSKKAPIPEDLLVREFPDLRRLLAA